ncbi:MAG: hypothetical protein K2Q25_15620 [Mycobacteriaceae bacterium]|nr:hypothetical protein [Mycobacteriaceae bacterium]
MHMIIGSAFASAVVCAFIGSTFAMFIVKSHGCYHVAERDDDSGVQRARRPGW